MDETYFLPLVTIAVSIILGGVSITSAFLCYLYGNINYEYGPDDIRLQRAWAGTVGSLIVLSMCATAFIGSFAIVFYKQY